MQEVMRMMTEQMFQDITGATKKAKEPNKVHPSYTHRDNRWWSEEEAGLMMDDRYVENAPYLPGFYLVIPGDPLALFNVHDYWYTPAEGEKSLEKLFKSLAGRDRYDDYYGRGEAEVAQDIQKQVMGGGGGRVLFGQRSGRGGGNEL